MARALGEDLRLRVLKAADEGTSGASGGGTIWGGDIERDPLDRKGQAG